MAVDNPSATPIVDSGIRISVDLRTNSVEQTQGTPPGILVFDSRNPTGTLTSTATTPNTFMGYAFNTIDPGRPVRLTGMQVYVVNNTGATLNATNLRGSFQFWNTYTSTADPVFGTPIGPTPIVVDVGPVVFNNGTFLEVDVTFPTPLPAFTGLANHGFAANWQVDTGTGLQSLNNLTSLLRFGPTPIAVGSSPIAGTNYGYRNASNRTDFNFLASDLRGFAGQTNQATVFRLFALGPTNADVGITKTDAPDPVVAGSNLTYTVGVTNAGPDAAENVVWTDVLPAGLTFVSLTSPAGWTCTTPAVGANGTVSCSNPSVAVASANSFTLVVGVPVGAGGTTINNTATVTTDSTDATSANNTASTATTVGNPPSANVTGTKTAAGTFQRGSNVTYTIVLSNGGTGAQGDNAGNEFIDVLPAGLTLVSANATSGTAVATIATNTVTWNGAIPAAGSVTITIVATIGASASGTISNQGTISYDSDGNGTNDATRQTDDPTVAGAANPTGFVVAGLAFVPTSVPTLSQLGALLAALALLLAGIAMQRRRAMR